MDEDEFNHALQLIEEGRENIEKVAGATTPLDRALHILAQLLVEHSDMIIRLKRKVTVLELRCIDLEQKLTSIKAEQITKEHLKHAKLTDRYNIIADEDKSSE